MAFLNRFVGDCVARSVISRFYSQEVRGKHSNKSDNHVGCVLYVLRNLCGIGLHCGDQSICMKSHVVMGKLIS